MSALVTAVVILAVQCSADYRESLRETVERSLKRSRQAVPEVFPVRDVQGKAVPLFPNWAEDSGRISFGSSRGAVEGLSSFSLSGEVRAEPDAFRRRLNVTLPLVFARMSLGFDLRVEVGPAPASYSLRLSYPEDALAAEVSFAADLAAAPGCPLRHGTVAVLFPASPEAVVTGESSPRDLKGRVAARFLAFLFNAYPVHKLLLRSFLLYNLFGDDFERDMCTFFRDNPPVV